MLTVCKQLQTFIGLMLLNCNWTRDSEGSLETLTRWMLELGCETPPDMGTGSQETLEMLRVTVPVDISFTRKTIWQAPVVKFRELGRKLKIKNLCCRRPWNAHSTSHGDKHGNKIIKCCEEWHFRFNEGVYTEQIWHHLNKIETRLPVTEKFLN